MPIKPKKEFSNNAREANEVYQEIRRKNKTLTKLNKIYNPTKKRNDALKNKLLDNPLFIQDYNRILEAYNDNKKLDDDTINILELFDFEPYE